MKDEKLNIIISIFVKILSIRIKRSKFGAQNNIDHIKYGKTQFGYDCRSQS